MNEISPEPDEIALSTLKADIRKNFPDFTFLKIRKLGEGHMSVATLVDEEWVFRFPKEKEGAEDLEKECKSHSMPW